MTVLTREDEQDGREPRAARPTDTEDPGSRGQRQPPETAPTDGVVTGEPPHPPRVPDDTRKWEFPENLSLESDGPDARFIEELYRELTKKMRIDRERRGH